MVSLRFHGRGGQGTVIASKLLAAAMFKEGWQVQAFPSFGAERSGAPVAAFLRADRKPITIHYQVYEPDHVVVLDPVLLGTIDVTAGLKPGGTILVNTAKTPDELGLPDRFLVAACDATGIALRHGLGSRTTPIVNTAMVGAWAALTGIVSLDAVLGVVPSLVPMKADANMAAARDAFGSIAVTVASHATDDHGVRQARGGRA
jgi:pyruvate ferredoxin oxidoreductase gamma subunit/2-oxoisovalerate ferredoxin oxidoreductase gamma subunit